jgi:superfamily II DNA or RNA helicase
MEVVHLQNHLWGIQSPRYSPALHAVAKSTPGMVWDATSRAWRGYPDAVRLCARRLLKKGIEVTGELPTRGCLKRTRVWSFGKNSSNNLLDGLREYQKEGVEFITSLAHTGVLLADDLGLGKQQPVDSLVLTPTGWREIGRLRVGDKVIGSDGRATRVVGVFPQGVKQNFRVTMSDGSSTEAGDEHLWTVAYWKGGRTFTTLTMTTEEIREKIHRRYQIPMLSAPVCFEDQGQLPIPPYLLGQLLANGALTHSTPSLTVHTVDWPEIRSRLEKERAPLGSVQVYGNAARVSLLGLAKHLRELELAVLSGAKRIPEQYQRASIKDRCALLQGLMDGDGSVSKTRNRIIYHSTCSVLAESVRELVENLGGIASVRAYDRHDEDKPIEYQVRIRTPFDIKPFSTKRKASRVTADRRPPTRTIVSIKPTRRVRSVCIKVAASDQLYVTEHAILTHNTSQAIRSIGALKHDAIVVCPSFVRGVWTREIAKWLPKTNVIELDGVTLRCTNCKGTGEDSTGASFTDMARGTYAKCLHCDGTGKIQTLSNSLEAQTVFMVHYDIVYAWERLLRKSGAQTIVFDEIHYLQSDKSRRSVSCRNLAIPMKYRIGLSGTPMTNRPSDLWNPLNTLCPWRFGKPFDFYIRYSDAHQETITMRDGPKTIWNTTGASHMKELNRRLRWFMLRRTKTDVKMELPPRIRQNIELEVPRSFTGYSKGLKADKAIRAALALAADGKLPKAIELVASHVTDKRKIVVFSHRVAVAKMIAAALQKQKIDARPATGEETRKQRQRLIDEKHDVLCATMDAMPVGVDLSYADVVVFCELDYVPSKILQCEGRVFRFGQKKSVLVQYVIALGTLDECIRDQVLAKLENFEKIIGNVDDNLQGDLGGEVLDTKEQLKSLTSKIMKQAEELELKRKEARRKKAA